MNELEYNSAEEQMTLPNWVTRPTPTVQLLISTSFILIWLIAEQASAQLLSLDGVPGLYLPAGIAIALVWALGLRYIWVPVVSAFLGSVVVLGLPLHAAILNGFILGMGYSGTAWLLRRTVPPGRLPGRPIDIAGLITAMLGGAMVIALLRTTVLMLLGIDQPEGIIAAWTIADALAMLMIAPLLVMVAAPWMCSKVCANPDETKGRYVRAVGCDVLERELVGWGIIGGASLGLAILACLPQGSDPRAYYLGFIALPALAMRYRLAGGLIALALTCMVGISAVLLRGIEPPAMTDMQLILIALSISTVLVGSFAVMRASAEEQRQTEQRWAALAIRGSGMGRWYWDVGTNTYKTDYVLADSFGYRPDKVQHQLSWWHQRLHPEDILLNRQRMDLLLSGKSDYFEIENRMLAEDGTWGWYHSQGTIIERDAQGKPKRVAGTHHDITERKELERLRADAEATHRSEQRFRTLAGDAPVAIFQTDAKGVFLYVNPAWQEMTGYEQTDALYRSAAAFAHPEDRNDVADHWSTALRTATPVSIEHRVVSPDGTTVWLQTQATPMEHNGVLLGYVGTGVDVTPYREAMTMIRDSEARYRTLADHAYDMLWRVDSAANFTYVSPSITKLMGFTPEEMVGTNAFDYFHPEDIERVRTKHEDLTPDTPEFHDIHRYRCKDGSYIVFEAVGRLVVPTSLTADTGEDADLQPYITGISRDVTQRVESERKQKELEDKLARSQKLDAIGTFATGIAHDFRNSLLAINLSAQSAVRKLDDTHPARPALATVEDAVAQAMAVTQSLLTFAQGQGAAKRPTDLAKLVRDNARLLDAVVPATIELAQTCPDQPVMVKANASELQQVLLNLVMNAKDAIEGQGRVAVSLVAKDDYAVLTVRDNGSGMPREVMDRALEPFYTTKARLKGTGLGLSQVHGIVSDHGGEISLDSAPGIGTTITITLPTHHTPPKPLSPNPQTKAAQP